MEQAPAPPGVSSGQGQHGGIGIGIVGGDAHFHLAPRQTLARSAYLEQVRRIAPPVLRDRDRELAELTRFCLDPGVGPYAWWQAGPWAGKSALLSSFVLRPPAEVVAGRVRVVSFFITARLAAQETREAFTDVLLEQLTGLLGQPLPTALPEATREAHLLGMMSRAAVACREAGGRLVLVVDGLDEDRGVTAGPGAHSIAGLLPGDPPAGMRVIVAGRRDPPVPDDVPGWHPLRDPAVIRPLDASGHAGDIRRLSGLELRGLLHGGAAGRDVLGLLAAARGGLSGPDLAELAEVPRWEAEGILRAAAGRTFTGRPSPSGRRDRPEIYLLGHEELQAQAEASLGGRLLDRYRGLLHAWADGYRDRGWPPDTPEYLLSGYYRLLDDLGDLPRMTGLALDAARHDRMLDLTGGDAAALAEARTALDRIAAQDAPDLATALALAWHRDQLTDRNRYIPDALPAVWAALDQFPRALALASPMSDPNQQQVPLAWVARGLAAAGQHERAEAIARSIISPYRRANALARVAEGLAAAGQHEEAAAIAARAETTARSLTDQQNRENALTRVAGALAATGQRERAEAIADSLTCPGCQALALARVAERLAEAGQHEHAAITATRADAIARAASAHLPEEIAARVAGALAAAGLYQRAETVARSAVRTIEEAGALARVAGALAAAGLYQRAEAVARSDSDPYVQEEALSWVAKGLAAAGQRERAEAVAVSLTSPYRQADALARVAGVLAAAGQHEQAAVIAGRAEGIARSITSPYGQAEALSWVAKGLAAAGQHEQAAVIAGRAAAITRSTTIQDDLQARRVIRTAERLAAAGQHEHAVAIAARVEGFAHSMTDPFWKESTLADWKERTLADVAGVLAVAGQRERAEAIVGSLTSPHWQADALARVAGVLAAAGQHEQAAVIAARAEVVARSDSRSFGQPEVLASVAGALAAAGLYQRAEAIAGSGSDLYAQASALARVAEGLAVAGQREQAAVIAARAEAIAGLVTDWPKRPEARVRVAGALAATGQRERAEAIARSLTGSDFRADALARVAGALTRTGDTLGAAQVAAAVCVTGEWTTAAGPVLELMPSAFAMLARTMRG